MFRGGVGVGYQEPPKEEAPIAPVAKEEPKEDSKEKDDKPKKK